MTKTRLNISLDQDLADFLKIYVQENRITVADLITQFALSLKRHTQGEGQEIIISNPDFHHTLVDMQTKLRTGNTEWHSFDEVFQD